MPVVGCRREMETGEERMIADELNSGDKVVIVRRQMKKRCKVSGHAGVIGICILS